MNFKTIYFLLVLLVVVSCRTVGVSSEENDLNYMQNIEQVATEQALVNAKNNTLQPGDQLFIVVSARDQSVTAPFNQNYSTSELIQNAAPGGNIPNQGGVSFNGPMYIVDAEGNINFPELGKISTTGKTLVNLKDELTEHLTRYIINPTVNIRLANFKVTVLGEVNRQGEYTLTNGQGTLLSALGLAGDLSLYGKRDDILIVRTVDGVITKERINLNDANFFNSPYYNLKQGDVIYVSSIKTKERLAKQNPNTSIILSVVGTVITVLALIFK